MPTRDIPWPNGTPCWVDYAAPDMEGARAFYADVMGWSYLPGVSERGTHLICLTKGRAAAALAAVSADLPARWRTYFAADDVEAVVRRVIDAGGAVTHEADDVGHAGRLAHATDPQGNPFSLWQAGDLPGARIYNEPGALVWNEAAVEDPAAARTFYTRVFGFRFDPVDGGGDYTTFTMDGGPLGGLGAHQPGRPKGWATCFSVSSTDAAVSAVEAGGGKVIMPAQDAEFGRFAVVEDPWSAPFTVLEDTR